MGTQKNLIHVQHVAIFLLIAYLFLKISYKTWDITKGNFKVGNNEIAVRLQSLKKKLVTHRACSNHAISKAEFGRSRSVCRVIFGCCSVTQLCTAWTVGRQASLSFTTSQSLLKLMSIELVMPSNHLILVTVILTSVGKDVAIRIHKDLCTAGRNVNWYSHYRQGYGGSS